jgi:hypothetical protein
MAYILSPENRHQMSGQRTVLISVDVMQPGNWQSGEQKAKALSFSPCCREDYFVER